MELHVTITGDQCSVCTFQGSLHIAVLILNIRVRMRDVRTCRFYPPFVAVGPSAGITNQIVYLEIGIAVVLRILF